MSSEKIPQDSSQLKTGELAKYGNWIFGLLFIFDVGIVIFIWRKTDSITGLTAALVFVGAIQAWIYRKQSKIMAAQAEISKNQYTTSVEQARLMRESIDQARKSSEKQLRAYINVAESEQIRVVMRKDFRQFCDIVVKNSGQTPAYDLIAVGEVHGSLPIGQSFTISAINRNEYKGGKSVLNPQAEIVLKCEIKRGEYPSPPAPLGTTMYVFGRVEYRDVFDNDRFTNFCFVLGKSGNMLIDETIAHTFYHIRAAWGNEAD